MWKDLSLKEKAAFMQVAVNNGIYDLQDIQQHYNKFAEGGYVREKNNNPVAFDEEGNLTDQITGEKGTMMLPEITIRGVSPETRARNYSSAYHPEDALEFFDIMTRPLTMPFSVSQQIGAIRNKINGGTYLGSLLGNEENLGIVSENFSKNHPYLSTAANIGIDILTPNAYKLNRFTPTRIRQGVYNNIVPGSYKESYLGSKRKEFKEALTDILSGNTVDDNPKWKEWLEQPHIFSDFKYEDNPKLATQMRMEAWKKSLGLPHKDKYLLKTGNLDADGRPIVTYNLEEIPLKYQQNFINKVNKNQTVIPDLIGNTGGWIQASKKDGVYRLEDLWDIQPFQNPNREGILPKAIKNKMTNRIETPDGKYPYKLEWKSWVPKWFINFDPTKIVGKRPFRNITELKPTILSKEQTYYKKPLEKVKDDLKKQIYDQELELAYLDDMDPIEAEAVVKNTKERVNKIVEDMPLETLESYRKQFYSPKELLDKYGLFTIQK